MRLLLLLYCGILKYFLWTIIVTKSVVARDVVTGFGDETRRTMLYMPAAVTSVAAARQFHKRNINKNLRRRSSQQQQQPREQQQEQQYSLHFVYSRAPEHLVLSARRNGEIERIFFANSARMLSNSDERMELYAKHFSQCAQINTIQSSEENGDDELVTRLEDQIEKSAAFQDDDTTTRTTKKLIDSVVDVLTDAIGIDESTAKLFSISSLSLLFKTIRRACLKNELRFQCAFGFLNDINKIREHINIMKQNDGNFKVMLESECKSFDKQTNDIISAKTSVYACVNLNAPQIFDRCRTAIKTYNASRIQVNERMQNSFADTLNVIKKNIDEAIAERNSDEMQRLLKKEKALILKTLNKLSYSEAFKCRQYSFMEKCVLEEVTSACSAHAANSLRDILRIGYLLRERGVKLHQQFVEHGVPEHRACSKFTALENGTNTAASKVSED